MGRGATSETSWQFLPLSLRDVHSGNVRTFLDIASESHDVRDKLPCPYKSPFPPDSRFSGML